MSKNKVARHSTCVTGKRSFFSEREAERSLGRSRTKRLRRQEQRTGTRKGVSDLETRYYECWECEGFHLTSEHAREHRAYADLRLAAA